MQDMGRRQTRNQAIDLLRLLFAVIIVVFHSSFLVKGRTLSDGEFFFSGGSCAVEFFFLISGFLMAHSISRMRSLQAGQLGTDTLIFMWRKAKRLWPPVFVSACVILGLEFFLEQKELSAVSGRLWANLPELFFMQQSGFSFGSLNGHTWYISAMLLAMFVLYPMARRHPDFFNAALAPLLGVFLIGWLVQVNHGLGRPALRSGLMMNGLVRALAEISLGCFCYWLAARLRGASLSRSVRIGCHVLSWSLLGLAFVWLWKPFGGSAFHLLFLFGPFAVIEFADPVVVFRSDCFLRFSDWCGAMSLPVYVNQYWAIKLVGKLNPEVTGFDGYVRGMFLTLSLILVFSAAYVAAERKLRHTKIRGSL